NDGGRRQVSACEGSSGPDRRFLLARGPVPRGYWCNRTPWYRSVAACEALPMTSHCCVAKILTVKSSGPLAGALVLRGALTLARARRQAATTADAPTKGSRDSYECRWAESAITLDGVADEAAWKNADVIDSFYLPWLGKKARPARTATSARLLWDREYL